MVKVFSKELEEKAIKLYNEGLSPRVMREKYKEFEEFSIAGIYKVLNRNNVSLDRQGKRNLEQKLKCRKFNTNDNAFDEMNEEVAYWIGFIYADGFLIGGRDAFGVTLAVEDIGHLEKLKEFLKTETEIKIYKPLKTSYSSNDYCRLVIHSHQLVSKLKEHGVTEQKTNTLLFPSTIEEKYIPHFIRGYIDGDGSITTSGKTKSGTYKRKVSVVGTMEVLEGIKQALNLTHIKLGKRRDNGTNNYTLDICGNKQVRRVLDELYKDSNIYLDRKYERYMNIVNEKCRLIQ